MIERQTRKTNLLLSGPVWAVGISVAVLGIGFCLPIVIGLKMVLDDQAKSEPTALVITYDEPEFIAESEPTADPAVASGPGETPIAPAPAKPDAAKPGVREAVEPKPTPGNPAVAKQPDPVPPDPASMVVSVENGTRLYNTMCVACHQADGAGKVGFAPYIRNRDFLALASDEFLHNSIVAGRPGTAMVPWAHLKPYEVESLVVYLRSAENPQANKTKKADPSKNYPGDPTNGQPLYATYCASCHGQNATGYAEGGAGPAIGNAGFLAVASDDFIFQTVKHGRAGTSMRGFVGAAGLANLSEGQVGDIIAYLRNRKATAPVVADRPGDEKAGHLHYNANCAACHQPDGSGLPGFAPSIRNRDFLAIASDEFIQETIRKGRPGTAMVQRPDLSDQVVGDIIAYLRSLPGPTREIKVDPTKNLASMGDAAHGQQSYTAYCSSCHGEGGKGYLAGGPGTAIGLSGFLDSASDDYIFQTLKQGRVGTPMRAFIGARGLANLSEQEAYDIIAYLRNLN